MHRDFYGPCLAAYGLPIRKPLRRRPFAHARVGLAGYLRSLQRWLSAINCLRAGESADFADFTSMAALEVVVMNATRTQRAYPICVWCCCMPYAFTGA